MKPVIIIPPETMSPEDIDELRKNDICIVTAKDPSLVRFVEPPPGDYKAVDLAAIALFRWVNGFDKNATFYKSDLTHKLVQILLEGSKPVSVSGPGKVVRNRRRGEGVA